MGQKQERKKVNTQEAKTKQEKKTQREKKEKKRREYQCKIKYTSKNKNKNAVYKKTQEYISRLKVCNVTVLEGMLQRIMATGN